MVNGITPTKLLHQHSYDVRRFISCGLLTLYATSVFIEISSGYFIPPPADNIFRDIQGDFCSRRPGEQCCPGRNDECYMPIADTICYCDIFCNRTIFDCCPDFWAHCLQAAGSGSETERPTYPPEPSTISKYSITSHRMIDFMLMTMSSTHSWLSPCILDFCLLLV